MTESENRQRRRNQQRAGYVSLRSLDGWVPEAFARRIREQVEMHRDDAERAAKAAPRPRGRPAKAP